MATLMAVTTSEFPVQVLASDLPVVVDFWAPRCPPCLAIAPWLEQFAAELEGRLRIVKVNVDEEHALIEQHGVIYIPELIMFAAGREAGRCSGEQSRRELRASLEHLLHDLEARNV